MPQVNFDQNRPLGLPGEFVRGETTSMLNPVRAQVTEIDMDADVATGATLIGIYERAGGDLIASFGYTAIANAASNAALAVAAALADPVVRGLLNDTGADVSETDSANLYFRKGGQSYVVAMITDPSAGAIDISNRIEAGYTAVDPGNLIQSDDLGSFEQWDGDGPAAIGIVLRTSVHMFGYPSGLNSNAVDATISGPHQLDILTEGEAMVQLAAGESVLKGDGPAGYDDATKTWKKNAGGNWVVVEGSQWRSVGSGVQRIFVRFPLHG